MTLLLLLSGEPATFQDLDPLATDAAFTAEGVLAPAADLDADTDAVFDLEGELTLDPTGAFLVAATTVVFTASATLTLSGFTLSTTITFACACSLTLDVPVETPPVPVSAHRALGGKAFVMPTPTFDSRGRPKV